MNVILLSKREGRARQLDLARPLTLTVLASVVVAFLGSAFALGLQLGRGNHERLVLSDTVRFGTMLAEQKKRLTEMADVDSREFNFDRDPPSGGPEGEGTSAQIPDLSAMLGQLEQRVDLRESQLSALENLILARELRQEIHPEGRPVANGFISSYFGERADPFDGTEAFHKGVDFAGSAGSNVTAVAAGVVTWAVY